ncbi:unnamed protein product [Porites evermanni]|uniref:DED domain-containing protein n=1 Tax=Porites evermanni TaxID=104178 RepID=A0ABN8LAR9_9CNID|nr:unnamed protein product [Porites evermanni]
MSKHEYRRLLLDINKKINANELKDMGYLCSDDLPKGTKWDNFDNALALFDVLERANRLGIDNTQILRGMLENLPKKQQLVNKVKEFENKRKAQSFGIISSLKRAAGILSGAVRMVCNFRTFAGGIILVGSGLALRSCSSFEEYSDAFNKVVLPAFTKLVELSESSLCFTVLANTPSALKELWDIYNNQTLKNRLQNFLVTEEIKQLASGEEMEVTVYIDEKEYREAYLDLTFQKNQAADNISQEGGRRRRNSDSFLSLSPKEDEMTLMLLNQAENKWNFKMQILEIEIDKLKRELAICGEDGKSINKSLDIIGISKFKPSKDEDLQRPQNGRRRHSDSDLYCKGRNEEVGERDDEQEQCLGEEKYSFIQKYLEQVHETSSVVTSTGESGFVTEGTASEAGHLEDRADLTPRLAHVNRRVISKIQNRLDSDNDALKRVLQSFGITKKPSRLSNFFSIFQLFPDTPVTMLKDVFEALQLYDLLELLEIKSIKPPSSLQLAYTLDEIKRLNEVAHLPTTYHSCGAVLIIADDENVSSASAIKTFFTDLDSKSDVTEILLQDIPTLRHLKEEINAMILEISARFGNLSESEIQRQTEVPRFRFLSPLKKALSGLKLRIRQVRSGGEAGDVGVIPFMLMQLGGDINIVRMQLSQIIFSSTSEGKTELWQTGELKSFLQSMMITAERIQENLTQLIKRSPEWFVREEEKEKKNCQENVSAVINRWIHRQDDFSFFAVFQFAPDPYQPVPEDILIELMSAITNKLKFVVCSRYSYKDYALLGPETLVAAYDSWYWAPTILKMLPEIFNKRWQTLDLKSMMSEFQRSSGTSITKDTLSSVHRFKRKEGGSFS